MGVASLDDFLIGEAVMEDEDFSTDAGGAEAFADRAFPEEGRACGGEGGEEACKAARTRQQSHGGFLPRKKKLIDRHTNITTRSSIVLPGSEENVAKQFFCGCAGRGADRGP